MTMDWLEINPFDHPTQCSFHHNHYTSYQQNCYYTATRSPVPIRLLRLKSDNSQPLHSFFKENMDIAGIGRILVWQGGSLWIGHVFKIAPHAHHGIQISIALEDEVLLRSEDEEWHCYTLGIIPSNLRHALDGLGRLSAQIFVEPESVEGRILMESYCPDGTIASLQRERVADLVHSLLSNFLSGTDTEQQIRDAHAIIARLTAGERPHKSVDPRIQMAIELMRQRLDTSLTLREVAAMVHLSPGRFRHLFVEETGTPLRSYVLWLRIATVIELMDAGQPLTAAAHAAGFADSAHLTRVFRRMFGSAPSALKISKYPRQHPVTSVRAVSGNG